MGDLVLEAAADSGFVAFDAATGAAVMTALDEGGGWWRVRTPSGAVRSFWLPGDTAETWWAVVERAAR
ncbi:hypothetical protein [Actinomadura atramentaria]|uniref:hypothetical protein n=1 Tax=Actinomadura atramentaria TaxID=1990 RepID=UPI000366863F|nr:hypothetical protein [Actinomadura atramentaria]